MREPRKIAALFRIPPRFLRSVQLERDFRDPSALDGYVVTEAMAEALRRVADGLKPGSGARAWQVTGDYGVGKSSFALTLAHLLHDPGAPEVRRIAEAVDWPFRENGPRLWPVLITGNRESLPHALARGVLQALATIDPSRSNPDPRGAPASAREVPPCDEASAAMALVEELRDALSRRGSGLLLVMDEMGKLLEHAALQPEPDDVFVLQTLAERAARSGARPFVFASLLHQGFHAYAGRLPAEARQEWAKIEGRFEDILFDQPLAHAAALVAGALNVRTASLPAPVIEAVRRVERAAAGTGWMTGAVPPKAAAFYPIHPTLLPPLVRFFARFGQHERSLFGFLMSGEAFGLQAFAERAPSPQAWYGLPEFYDYVRAAFGHRLAGDSHRNHWVRITALVDTTDGLAEADRRVLKAVAILNLVDAEDILPTDAAVEACLAPRTTAETRASLGLLLDRGLLHRRGAAGGYRLWPNTSVNLRSAFDDAARAIPGLDRVAANLGPFLDKQPLLARRHYVERGTLRYFDVRYTTVEELSAVLDPPTRADGVVVVVLVDDTNDHGRATAAAVGAPFVDRPEVIVGVGSPLTPLRLELLDAQRWQWLSDNTPELAHDPYAAAEVARQLAASRRSLTTRLSQLCSLRDRGEPATMSWFLEGKPRRVEDGIVPEISRVCDGLYGESPRVTHELVNRNVLSSAAAAARMRLVEGMFEAADKPQLGLDPRKSPPERSMYLAVLRKGLIHVEGPDGHRLQEPPPQDPLNLRPALAAVLDEIDAAGDGRVPVSAIFSRLKAPPLGVRDGLSPLLLALVMKLRGHELAVYELGTFLPRPGPTDFLRLTKAPATFELQRCRIEGVRREVFDRMVSVFARPVPGREAEALDVVGPLCRFAAALPEYTRRTVALPAAAIAVRDALLTAREPVRLLFDDLPLACGVAPFDAIPADETGRGALFVTALRDAVDRLAAAYPDLVKRLFDGVAAALRQDGRAFDPGGLAARAARVSLVAREPRLRTFALRLRDVAISEEAWIEALAGFVLSRPPRKWGPGDEARFLDEVGGLAETFTKAEAAAFGRGGDSPAAEAIRLNLTRGDGRDLTTVVMPGGADGIAGSRMRDVRASLPEERSLRLRMLADLLWEELSAPTPRIVSRDGGRVEDAL